MATRKNDKQMIHSSLALTLRPDACANDFFGLDHTPRNYETNPTETLIELYAGYEAFCDPYRR